MNHQTKKLLIFGTRRNFGAWQAAVIAAAKAIMKGAFSTASTKSVDHYFASFTSLQDLSFRAFESLKFVRVSTAEEASQDRRERAVEEQALLVARLSPWHCCAKVTGP